jgi:molecular chaperone DnaK
LLKEEAEKIKIKMSSEKTVAVSLPLVTIKDNRPVGLFVDFTREQLVGLIDGLLMETLNCIQQVLKDAGLKPGDIHEILLVGGSTRIPRVRELIKDFFGKNPRTDVHPDEAVALGAAVQAGLKSGALSGSGLVATDVAPFSMGIAVLKEWKGLALRPGGFHAIIPRNTTIPVTRSDRFYTTADGQTAASIEIYQGESEWVKNNHRLGEFVLEGIPVNTAGKEAIEVTYRYNLNGILEVTASCVSTGQKMSVTVQDALNRDSREAFEESRARLEDLFRNAGPGDMDELDDEELDLLDEMDGYAGDGDPDESGELSPTVLHPEAAGLRDRAGKLLETYSGVDRMKLERIIQLLDEAMSGDDVDRLQSAIDEATDTLIELEL